MRPLSFLLAGFAASAFASTPLEFQTGPFATGNAGAVALADFNGDGKMDVVHANAQSAVVRLGDGTGGLGAAVFTTNLPTGGSAPVAAGDLNGDGIPDFAVGYGTFANTSPRVAVFFSNGAGGFTAGPALAVAEWPGSIAIGDLDGDAVADLVVGSNVGSLISVVRGTGGGAFAGASFHAAGSTPRSVAIGDFNHDGKADVVALGGDGANVLLGNGNGTFAAATPYAAGSFPVALAVADIDGDGHLDLAVANDGTDGVSLLFGDGLGAFSEPQAVAVARFPVGVLLRDLNGDGKPDLVVSTQFNGGQGSNAVRLLRNLGNRTFELQSPLFVPAQGQIAPPRLAAGDMDGDRRGDLVIGDITSSFDGGDRTRVFRNSTMFPARRADFNGDRRSDILWRYRVSGENYVYLMDEKNIAGEGYLRTVEDQAWKVAGVGDFDGNGKADVLWRNAATGENYVYFMDGASILNEGYLRAVADLNWRIAGIGDFDGDGKDDILWRNSSSGENYAYFMNGLSIVNEGYLRTVANQAWEIAGVGDFDGDEKADILWRHATSGENYLYLMSGLSIANEGYLRAVADTDWRVAAVADFDGDGQADILWRNSSTGANYLYFMHGTAIKPGEGYLRTVADPAWRIVATGDYDGDGRADILWRNSTSGENYVYFMDGLAIKPNEGYLRAVADASWRVVSGPPLARQLADVVIAVDTSGSMSLEAGLVQAQLNSFAASLRANGIEPNIVLIAASGGICAPAPLGSGACPADQNLPGYRHVAQSVQSNDAFQQILNTYPQWSASLRPGSRRALVVVSDDESDMAASTFSSQLLALDPALAGYRFHAIVATIDPLPFPSPNVCSFIAAARGDQYIELANQTGGVVANLCLQNFQPAFDAIAAAIAASFP